MKKLYQLGIFFLLSIIFSTSAIAAKTIFVGAYHNPPLISRNEQGMVEGLYPEILGFIAQREGWNIEYRFDTFAQNLENLKQGKIDLLPAIAYSAERAVVFDFNQETVWLNWGTIYTHPSVSIQSFLDLNGKRVFVVAESIYYQALREIVTGFSLDCQFIEVEDFETVLRKVREEPQSIGVVSRLAGQQFGLRYGLKASPLVFAPVSLRFAVPKGKHGEILQVLDRWLVRLKEDPQSIYYRAIRKLSDFEAPWRPPRWLYFSFLVAGMLVAALLVFNHLLRLQVKKQTRELLETNAMLREEIHRRQETEARLALRLELEETLGQISARFLSGIDLDELIEIALSQIGTFLRSEYLLAQLPGAQYRFGNLPSQDFLPHLPELLQYPQFREVWERERWLFVTIGEKLQQELSRPPSGNFFAFPLRSDSNEGFVEGVLQVVSPDDRSSYLPIIIQYLGALLEYVWAMKQQREKDRWFRMILQSLGDGVITTDPESRVTFLNPMAENLTGWSLEEARGKPLEAIFTVVDEKTQKTIEDVVNRILQKGETISLGSGNVLIRRTGEPVSIDDSGAPIVDEKGKVLGAVFVFRDVTEKKRLEEQVRQSEQMYHRLFNSMVDGFAILEAVSLNATVDYRIIEANPSFKTLFRRFGELEGKLISDLLPKWQERFPNLFLFAFDSSPRVEIFVPEIDAFLEISTFKIPPERFGIVVTDITARKKAEEKVRYFTFHDSLTGLYNRLFAEEELKRLDDNRHLPLSVLFADLNGLKFLNDAFGHEKGDLMIRKAAQILKNACRESDIVARFGGDEFIIVLPTTSSNEVSKIAERIQKLCQKTQREEMLFLGLSLGSATKEKPSQNLWEILKEAEKRAYERKLLERKFYQEESILQLLEEALFSYGIENQQELETLENLAVALGEKIGILEAIPKIKLLARFHDVGKLSLPLEILHKKTTLTPEEWTIFKTHPAAGYRIARTVAPLTPIAEEIYAFRERWNGSGYPLGKKGEDIPFLTRLVQVVAAYVALASPRIYRPNPLTPAEALARIQKEAGLKFDPQMVSSFLDLLSQGSGFPS